MHLVEEAQQRDILAKTYTHIVNSEPGGSGANTMIGVSMLGGNAAYMGRVGRDEHGKLYSEGLYTRKVRPCTAAEEGTTGICLVMITPDA